MLCVANTWIGLEPSVTRRKQSKPSNTQEPKQRSTQQRTTARSSANPTKLNHTATRYTIVKDTLILHIAKPQAASSKSTHTWRMYTGICPHAPGHQEAGHPVPLTDRHDPPRVWMQCDAQSPRELSAHWGIGIVSDQVESEVSRVARGVAEVGGGG